MVGNIVASARIINRFGRGRAHFFDPLTGS